MRTFSRRLAFATLAGLALGSLLVACGGGDDRPSYSTVVSFGDSLSDAGAYQVGTIAQLGGGRFTVNGSPDSRTWTERLAVTLGTPAQCAARTGLLPNAPGVTGAAVTDIAGCYNYAQGSSRVTAEGSGPNGIVLQTAFGEQNLGFMANSLHEQFTRHLAKVGGSYSGRELVTVNAGGNDLFMQLTALGAAFGGGAAAVATGTVAGWPQNVLDTVALGGANAVNAGAGAAVAAMAQAGTELANDVNALVLAKGATHVIVRNLGDVNATPFGLTLDAQTRALITQMTTAFDGQLAAGLGQNAALILYDEYAEGPTILANPSKYGYSNVTDAACGPNAFSGSSIICNTGNLIAGDTSGYRFADSVHPTPLGHQQTMNSVLALMDAAGWH